MKRFLYLALCFLLTMAIASCFVACGDEENPGPASSTTDTVETGNSGSTDSSVPDDHEHTYATEYSYDENNHFYAATCQHSDEKSGIEAHTHDIYTGICKCGHTTDLLANALDVISANKGSAKSGELVYTSKFVELNALTEEKTIYKFFEDYLYIKKRSEYTDEYYYSLDAENNIFGVHVQNSTNIIRDTDTPIEVLGGITYGFNCINDSDSVAYGAEAFIKYYYDLGLVCTNGDLTSLFKDGVFSFSYGTTTGLDLVTFYTVEVTFTIDEATSSLAGATVFVNKYAGDSYTVVDNVYTLKEDAVALYEYTYTVTQSTAALEQVKNPYDPDVVLINSLSIKDASGNSIDGATIEIDPNKDSVMKLYLKDLLPATAMLNLSEVNITVINNDNGLPLSIYPYYKADEGYYMFSMGTPGSYTLTVTVDEMEFKSTVNVALKKPQKLSSQIYVSDYGEFEQTSTAEVYVGSPLYFTSYVDVGYDGSYTAKITGGVDESIASITDGEINGQAVSVFRATETGTYSIRLTSNVKYLVCKLTVTVVEAPNVEAMLNGSYNGTDEMGWSPITAVFNKENSTIEVTYEDSYGKLIQVISYVYENGKLSFDYVSGDPIVDDFYISDNYELIFMSYGVKFVLVPVYMGEVTETGSLTIKDADGTDSATYTYERYSTGAFIFYLDGNVTTDVAIEEYDGVYTLKHQGGEEALLLKTSGDEGVLAGEYELENGAIVIIGLVEPESVVITGTLKLTDKISAGTSVSYTGEYTFTCTDGVFEFYLEDELVKDISLVIEDGEYIFKFPAIAGEQILVKTDGNANEVDGTYEVQTNLGTLAILKIKVNSAK